MAGSVVDVFVACLPVTGWDCNEAVHKAAADARITPLCTSSHACLAT